MANKKQSRREAAQAVAEKARSTKVAEVDETPAPAAEPVEVEPAEPEQAVQQTTEKTTQKTTSKKASKKS